MQSAKVLLVDDNPVNMVLNNKMVRSLIPDAQLTEATDGLQALEQCKEKTFDIILMDVQMPVMDGIEATKQIRLLPEYASVPIIGVTAGNVLGEKEKCLDSGMNDFLPKPLRQADLLGILEKYIFNENHIPAEESSDKEKFFDIKLLNEHMGDDDDDFKQIFLNLVVQELTQAEENIRKSAAEKDTTALKMILHKLKGTAGTAGLTRLTEHAADWEKKSETDMDFIAMEKEIIRDITTGLQAIKNLIQ